MLLWAPWSRQKSNHSRNQTSKKYSQLRATVKMHSSITPIKIHLKRQRIYLFSSLRLTMYFQIPMKEHSMTVTERKSCLTKKTCPRKILKFILLVLIFGAILRSLASRVMKIIMGASTKSTDKFSKSLKPRKIKLLQWEMT